MEPNDTPYRPYAVAVGTLLTIWFTVGLVGNTTQFVVFARYRHLCSPANILLINLGIANLGMAVCCIPLSASSSFLGRWIFRWEGCTIYGFFSIFFGLTVIGNTALLAVSRYILVCRRELAQQLTFSHYRYFAMVAWGNALLWAVMPIFGWSRYDLEPLQTFCSIDWQDIDGSFISYIVSLFIINFVLPVCLMVFCNLRAYQTSRSQQQQQQSPTGGVEDQQLEDTPSMYNVDWASQPEGNMLGVAFIIFFVSSWLPYAIICMMAIIFDTSEIPVLLTVIAPLAAKTSIWVNPMLVLLCVKKFRHYTSMLVFCRTDVQVINPSDITSRNSNESGLNLEQFI
ncbi:visual pigment-like receptor peropsin [Diadema setosum]|uniref:visual pigment-like receptor peropsin n=1 Tax=Diadema setosum TaxID=31175 RepID=UPI003B3B32C3